MRIYTRRFYSKSYNLVLSVILGFIIIITVNADLIAEHVLIQKRDAIDFNLVANDIKLPSPPGVSGHLLGTDVLGRDIAVRVLYGGQVSVGVGFISLIFVILIGVNLGVVGGFFGGWLDKGITVIVQILSNLPTIFLLIICSFFIRFDILSLSLFIALFNWTNTYYIIRGQVLAIRNRDYIVAARAVGATNRRIIFLHVLPNILPTILVSVSFSVSSAMLSELALGYLGYGVNIPTPGWGNIISDGLRLNISTPWQLYSPVLAFVVTIITVSLLSNNLRDALDPSFK